MEGKGEVVNLHVAESCWMSPSWLLFGQGLCVSPWAGTCPMAGPAAVTASLCSMSVCPSSPRPQEGHLRGDEPALRDTGAVPRGRDVPAPPELQHQ